MKGNMKKYDNTYNTSQYSHFPLVFLDIYEDIPLSSLHWRRYPITHHRLAHHHRYTRVTRTYSILLTLAHPLLRGAAYDCRWQLCVLSQSNAMIWPHDRVYSVRDREQRDDPRARASTGNVTPDRTCDQAVTRTWEIQIGGSWGGGVWVCGGDLTKCTRDSMGTIEKV